MIEEDEEMKENEEFDNQVINEAEKDSTEMSSIIALSEKDKEVSATLKKKCVSNQSKSNKKIASSSKNDAEGSTTLKRKQKSLQKRNTKEKKNNNSREKKNNKKGKAAVPKDASVVKTSMQEKDIVPYSNE